MSQTIPHPEAQPPDPDKAVIPERIGGLAPEKIDVIPPLPGVYIMRAVDDKVLYIGKAANLLGRVRSYFTKVGDARFNVRYLMRHVVRVETIITANEKEAFLLENTLIKQHQPRYNIRLRDDKTYVSVRINVKHDWPRAVVMRRRNETRKDGSIYLGPYASASAVRETLRQMQRIFPIRSCPDSVLRNRARPCLLHQIGRCCAPCVKPIDRGEYREMVEELVLFLKGKKHEVMRRLESLMKRQSEAMEYEAAAGTRDRLRAIEETMERQGVHRHEGSDYDVMVIERGGGYGAFVVFSYRNGLLIGSRPYLIKDHDREKDDLMAEFIARYYAMELPPREVLCDPAPRDAEFLMGWLRERREAACEILTPQRGEKRRLIESAQENARRLLEQHLSGHKSLDDINAELVEKFHLAAAPESIECYDISTIQGFATVGSKVCFVNGEPNKNGYRRFRIKSFEGQDDFAAMREVLMRRFRRVAEGEEPPPGLVVIDGGKGQLGVAVDVLAELGLTVSVPVVSMAKARIKLRGDEQIRTEERFFLPGRKNPVVFKPNSPALHMLVRLRDEAHRFGITYHRELRTRRNLRSVLEDLPGVGKSRARALIRHFGSLKKLKEATAEEIMKVQRIPGELAERIASLFRAENQAQAELPSHDIRSDPV